MVILRTHNCTNATCIREHLLHINYDPEGDGAAIIDDLEWNVQGDPTMEGCPIDDVRRQHRDLMCSLYGAFKPAFIRHKHPIFIDKESVDSVLAGPAPGTWRAINYRNPTACHCHEYAVVGPPGRRSQTFRLRRMTTMVLIDLMHLVIGFDQRFPGDVFPHVSLLAKVWCHP